MGKTVYMVAEKPMLALAIAKILSNGSLVSRKGFNGACSVHEWNGTFKGQQARLKMTSTCGHVMSLDFPSRFNNWDRTNPADLFNVPTEKKEANVKLKMPAFLASEAQNCDELVLWLDCDKEGENICFEVIDCVQSVMRPGTSKRNFHRAHFSAITDKDIKAAYQNVGVPNELESLSVDARQELDLRIGCAFTRFQTKYFQGKYGDLDSSLISFGPCQTPTLGFCVERHDFIMSFKPELYWFISLTVSIEKSSSGSFGSNQTLSPEWTRGRIFDREVAQFFLDRIKNSKTARVIDVSTKEGTKARPTALNTVELMRVASARLGIGPQQAMSIAEHLYTQGYISYPRTETTSYPSNFDLVGTLKLQTSNSRWGSAARNLLDAGINKPKKGVDVGDHPPITPMKPDSGDYLSGDHARLYEYIVRHFIATISEDCKFLVTTARFDVGEEIFTLTGKQPLLAGFTEVMPWAAIEDNESLPDIKKGQVFNIDQLKLTERETGPPDYLTESELITLMEKHGIGTDASIPVHINNIQQRNYVTVGSGRRLIPTQLGIVLVHGYLKIDPELVLPTMRAAVEEQLTLIAKGEADYLNVKRHALEIFKLKFLYFMQTVMMMDELFEVSFTSLADSGKPFSRCGKCRRYMKLVESKPQRLHCTHCEDTYALPFGKEAGVRIYGEHKCPLDEFDLVYFHGGPNKSYPLCPYCYNNPPFPDMKKGISGCNQCQHPSCKHAFAQWAVAPCTTCEWNGLMVLDPNSGPRWKVACNKCPVMITIFDKAIKVKVGKESCPECYSHIVIVKYKEGVTPLDDGLTEVTGCMFCDPKLAKLVDFSGVNRAQRMAQGGAGDAGGYAGGGRGGGRGRGGRGRGRGRGGGRGRGRGR